MSRSYKNASVAILTVLFIAVPFALLAALCVALPSCPERACLWWRGYDSQDCSFSSSIDETEPPSPTTASASATPTPSSAASDVPETVVRLGGWNIKKLGHGSSKDYPLVASIIEENFDALAVVEVMQKDGAHPGYDALLSTLGSGWQGFVVAEPRPNTGAGHAEYNAIVWRKTLLRPCPGTTGLTYFIDNDGSASGVGIDLFDREPAFACLTWGTTAAGGDFVLAGYHARWAGGNSAEIAREVDHIDAVFDQMAAAHPGERDLFVVGDFNLVPAKLALQIDATDRTTGAGSTLNRKGEVTTNLYDHILVENVGDSTELVGNAEVLDVIGRAATPTAFFKSVSDHLPIRVTLKSSSPDDD